MIYREGIVWVAILRILHGKRVEESAVRMRASANMLIRANRDLQRASDRSRIAFDRLAVEMEANDRHKAYGAIRRQIEEKPKIP